jgi:TolB-like protein/cytochrome c-type biogenesis protein CcmH/NrfG
VRVYRLALGSQQTSPSKHLAEPLPLPDKPSIAVLPFTNMSGDPDQEYFSDGITEDIITELSRFRSLFVIARNSSFHYKGQSPKVQDVGRELGVRYVVEGSVRKAGNRVRVTAQLVEAASGNHLWAERYDRDLEDIFAVQDELVRTITSTVGGRVESAGEIRAERLSESDLLAYDHVLRASAALWRMNKEDNRRAACHARQAIELDPQSAQAHHVLASALVTDWMAHWVEDREATLLMAFESAKRAVMLDESSSAALAALGEIQVYRREFEDARHSFERAIKLNPNDAQALGLYGIYLIAVGRSDEALVQYELTERMNPLQRDWVDWLKGIAFFTVRRYDEAIATLRTIKDPINEVRGWLAASYAGAGRLEEARATLEEFLRVAENDMAIFPGRKLAAWEDYWHGAMEYQDDADFEHLYDALRKAGLED